MIQPAFNANFFDHVNRLALAEKGAAKPSMLFIERVLRIKPLVFLIALLEVTLSRLLTLPIPVYSDFVYILITNLRGLPRFSGVYLRALYYRGIIKGMESNVLIEEGVFFAHPAQLELKEFSFIDKNVIIMAKSAKVGRRVHIAPNVFISGGGEFEARDYSCIATNSQLITSTEILRDGARCSGPMTSPEQRNVLRGKIVLCKDAFVGANATILPDVEIAEGSVIGAGVTIARSTEPWCIYVAGKPRKAGIRDAVKHPDN